MVRNVCFSENCTYVLNELSLGNLPNFVTFRCATEAFQKGYSVIGIQFWGECWSGPNAAKKYDKYGGADTCVNEKFKKEFNDTTQCQMATGMDSTNYVYRIAPSGKYF